MTSSTSSRLRSPRSGRRVAQAPADFSSGRRDEAREYRLLALIVSPTKGPPLHGLASRRANSELIELCRAEDRPRAFHLQQDHQVVAASGLEVLERKPQRNRLARPHANGCELPYRVMVAELAPPILASRDRD